jgi:hypothetical protein
MLLAVDFRWQMAFLGLFSMSTLSKKSNIFSAKFDPVAEYR